MCVSDWRRTMVAQKKLGVTDPDEWNEPLLPAIPNTNTDAYTHTHTNTQTHTHTNTHTHTHQAISRSKRGDAREFFLSR